MSEFLSGIIRGIGDEYIVSLRDKNAQLAAQYQRNADKMVEIVRLMDEEIGRRGLIEPSKPPKPPKMPEGKDPRGGTITRKRFR